MRSLAGTTDEVPLDYLAGQIVTVATSLFDSTTPVLELDQQRIPLRVVDPVGNGTTRRPPRRSTQERASGPVDFDPGRTLVSDDEEDADDSIF